MFYNRNALNERNLGTYDSSLQVAADYAFITNCAFHFEIKNIPQRLINYRVHANQISAKKRDLQIKTARYVRHLQVQRLQVTPTEQEMYLFNQFMENTPLSEEELVTTSDFLNTLLLKNEEVKLYRQDLLFVYFQQLFSNALKRTKIETSA